MQILNFLCRRRLEKRLYISLPQRSGRKSLFEINLKDVKLATNVNFERLSVLTEGYSGVFCFSPKGRREGHFLTSVWNFVVLCSSVFDVGPQKISRAQCVLCGALRNDSEKCQEGSF